MRSISEIFDAFITAHSQMRRRRRSRLRQRVPLTSISLHAVCHGAPSPATPFHQGVCRAGNRLRRERTCASDPVEGVRDGTRPELVQPRSWLGPVPHSLPLRTAANAQPRMESAQSTMPTGYGGPERLCSH